MTEIEALGKKIIDAWMDSKPKESGESTIEDTKKQLAEMYLDFLDQQKGWILATGAGLGVSLNPLKNDAIKYLTTDTKKEKTDIFSTIGKNIKKKFIEKITWWTLLEYDKKSLNKMKALIVQNKDNEEKLKDLMAQIQSGIDPTLLPSSEISIAEKNTTAQRAAVEYADKNNREKVLASLDGILAQDAKKAIPYVRGGKNIGGLDCSGLIYHTIKEAGLNIDFHDSRWIFQSVDTKLVELDEDKKIKKDTLKDIQKWDLIFWNSTNSEYKRSTGSIPEIIKDDKTYRIHHIAFIDKINYDDGTIDVVESNWTEWVTKSTVNVYDWLTTEKKHTSELYVGHVNYNDFPAATKLAA